jgi:hypothetical protein
MLRFLQLDYPINRILLAGAFLPICAVSNAHHAPALYDNDHLMSIEGEVVKLSYRFPHSQMRVRTSDGEEWTISLAPPDVSERQGKKEALLEIQPGERVKVFGWPHKIKHNEIRSHELVFPDGRIIEGAFNSLYQPRHQKDLKKMLSNTDRLNRLNQSVRSFSPEPNLFAAWWNEHDAMTRLALDLEFDRAFFIGIKDQGTDVFPGIKDHLACLAATHPTQIVSSPDEAALIYMRKRNEWYARYLEAQLNICD